MKKYKSPIFKHIHQEATDRFEAGAITAEEMHRYDAFCLVSPADTPTVHALRSAAMTASPGTSRGRSAK
ncbi:hypothetical protein [Leadbettera azotonutricia]|uniref:Transcriptional regulator, XRE family n=1 Tax=Leadbettera azotonutricia (strain ATCC BAA-888 / DSM 13862 / ZAS-9) TaxID=545695 RepID=F5YFP0_LEAAZ|nr:hypothetical protein [Leadbettera azotonutricia]AEF80295.1 transcriptional regulator, XRE family [Leadbettera azotonutricia ZAS-9]